MRKTVTAGAMALAVLAGAPAMARPLPPLACEAQDGSWTLGLYGSIAQMQHPDLLEFVSSEIARGPGGWPAWQALVGESESRVVRVTEAACSSAGGDFPLSLELFDPTSGSLKTGCCTVAE